jgi:hypothetical protein
MQIDSADNLRVHHDRAQSVVILKYEGHGRTASGPLRQPVLLTGHHPKIARSFTGATTWTPSPSPPHSAAEAHSRQRQGLPLHSVTTEIILPRVAQQGVNCTGRPPSCPSIPVVSAPARSPTARSDIRP